MTDCECCGMHVYGTDMCDGCLYDGCSPYTTWHCGCERMCDGSCDPAETED